MEKNARIPLRALIVESSGEDCALLLRELERGGYDPTHERVDTPEEFMAALDGQEWDIVFADYTMPRLSGIQALSMVHERGLDVPFIFVSDTIGEDTAVAAMKAGAHDYIMKGNTRRLVPAVGRELCDVQLRRERTRAEAVQRAADGRFRNILTIAADGVIILDEDQRIVTFNHGAEQIFGYRAEEVTGQLVDLLLPSRYVDIHRGHVQKFAGAPETARRMNDRGTVYGRRKNGAEFPAEASISKLTENGRTTFTMILRDITEHKRAEEELRLLQSTTQAAGEAGDLHTALAATLGRVCEVAGGVLAQAWVPRPDGASIECTPAWHCRDVGMEGFRAASLRFAFALGEGLPGRVWASKQPLWIKDVTVDAHFPRARFAKESGLRAAMGIPVLAGHQVVAVLEFFAREPRKNDDRLVELISGVAAQLGGIFQRKRAEERLHHLAYHDALTGLPNRVLFNDRLQQAITDANRHERILGVAFLDVDRFKNINDSLGHGVGDLLLKSVAERLRHCVREGDTVARLSGDEFAVVLAGMAQVSDAARVARKILDSFAQPFHIAGHELFTSASLGMTLFPFDDNSIEGLLRNADIAMYRAKEAGGNAYRFYAADMTSNAQERLLLENALRRALERQEFLLHYQPVVDLRSGRIVAVEALIRWQHPERGLVSPGVFIPLAEETGLITRIGEWVLQTACEQCRGYRATSLSQPPLRVVINVSPRQFEQPDLAETIGAILRRTAFDPASLDIEITESLLMQNVETKLGVMRKLSALGARFSIDDFGTGYSSLSHLKRLPIGYVKIDQSFVRDAPADANDAAIVTAIVSMAHSLGIQVIGEGVETRKQFGFLCAHGCDAAQGYYFSRPLPAEELGRLLREARPLPL